MRLGDRSILVRAWPVAIPMTLMGCLAGEPLSEEPLAEELESAANEQPVHGEESLAPGERLLSPEEALEEDLTLIASDRGWTLDQARARHEAAEAVGRVAVKLATERPDVFVGSVLSDEPTAPPRVLIKGLADRKVLDLVLEEDAEIEVIDRQPFSFVELEERRHQMQSHLQELGFPEVSTTTIIERGQLEVIVRRPQGKNDLTVPGLMRSMPLGMRGAEISMTDDPIYTPAISIGGMKVMRFSAIPTSLTQVCTSSWTLVDVVYGIFRFQSTAGHCYMYGLNQVHHPSMGSDQFHTATLQAWHMGSYGDLGVMTVEAPAQPRFFTSPTNIREVKSVEHELAFTVGEDICSWSPLQGRRYCSQVSAIATSCTTNSTFVRMRTNNVVTGDSGAGWHWNNRAYGVTAGYCNMSDGSRMDLFSKAAFLDDVFGTAVEIAP